jgi:hypothetical protein
MPIVIIDFSLLIMSSGILIYFIKVLKEKEIILKPKEDPIKKTETSLNIEQKEEFEDYKKVSKNIENLKRLGLKLKDDLLDQDSIRFLETILLTIECVQYLNKEYRNTKEAILINRLSSLYLPDIVNNYINLSPERREKERESVFLTLDQIDQRLKNSIDEKEEELLNKLKSSTSMVSAIFDKN